MSLKDQEVSFEITLLRYLSWVFLKFGGFCQGLCGMACPLLYILAVAVNKMGIQQ